MTEKKCIQGWPRALGCLALVVGLVLAGSAEAQAQTLYGAIVGNVSDQTGATIPGADVTATHNDSGRVRTAITNEVGGYDFPTIQAGTWTVKVAMPGFKEYVNSNVRVTVNTVTRVNIILEVGELSETLTVTSETALLQTDRAEVRAEIAEKALKDLPVPLGRNYQHLFDTLPGFTTPENAHSFPTNPSRALQFGVNGASRSLNDIRIDGASQYDIWLPHITVYIPSLEAIQTVNVVSNSFEAEQGLAGGAAVNVQIKSGTNDYHGSGFWFHSDNALQARPYFRPPEFKNPKYINNQFGGTVGGPIKQDKLFFFLSYEGSPERSYAGSFGDIPDMAMRTGDLSASDRPVYDPLTGDPDGSNRTAFPNNIIPDERIHPVSRKILDMLPQPMFPEKGITQNFFSEGIFEFNRNVLDGKIDWHVNDKLNMYGRLSILRYDMLAPTFFGPELLGRPLAGGNSTHADGGTYGTTIAGTYVFTPTFVVDANFGWTRKDTASEMTRLDENVGSDIFGIPGTNGTREFEGSIPRIRISGFETIGITNAFMPYYRRDPQTQYAGNANWTKGRHNVRFGVELVSQHMNQTQPEFPGAFEGAQGGLNFNNVTTVRGGLSANDYNHFGGFLLGLPRQMGRILQVDDEYNTRMNFYSLYIRDRWQATPKLSLSLGTRWEYLPMPTRADRGVERYDFINNKMLVCGVSQVPEDCGVKLSNTLFAPRLGIAYRATDTFVIRAGYGITNDPFSLARPHRTNPPMLIPLNVDSLNSFTPAGSLTTGIPLIEVPDLGNGIVDVAPNVAINSVGDELKRGYVQSWNITLQKQLPGGFVGEVGYVATRQVRQLGFLDQNAGQVIGAGNAGRPYFAEFGRTARTALFTAIGHSSYDSMQAQLNRRFSNGFQINTNYTWSKSLGIAGLSNSDSTPRIQALEYYHLNRALTSFHTPHRLNVATLFELPFGRGKRWAADGAGAAILGGWQFNATMRAHTGTPFTVTSSGPLNLPGSAQRADRVKEKVEILGFTGPGQSYFDPFAFAPVTEERFGTSAFNSLLGPSQFNMDVGLFRRFQITEGVDVQFRAEALNFTNTPHFNNPEGGNTNVSNMLLNADGTIRDLRNYTSVTGTRNTGREGLDQRIFKFGIRIGF